MSKLFDTSAQAINNIAVLPPPALDNNLIISPFIYNRQNNPLTFSIVNKKKEMMIKKKQKRKSLENPQQYFLREQISHMHGCLTFELKLSSKAGIVSTVCKLYLEKKENN